MDRLAKIIDNARSKLYYSRPVYIPGYEYSPWRNWLILFAVALIAGLIFASFVGLDKPVVETSKTDVGSAQTAPAPAQPSATPQTPNGLVYYPVDRVVDGDTIIVTIDDTTERIRFIGVDTPETVDPRKPVQCFGPESSNYVKNLLNGKKVGLESDKSQGNKDKYNRLLRYVFLADGTNLDEELIAKGYGREYTYDLPYKYQDQFIKAEHLAQTNKIGLWASNTCDGNI